MEKGSRDIDPNQEDAVAKKMASSFTVNEDANLDESFPHPSQSSFPLPNLPDELVMQVGSFLDVRTLKHARYLNRRFRDLFSRDEAGWVQHFHHLWQRKAHIHPVACHLLTGFPKENAFAMKAYRVACFDAAERQEIALDELCFDMQRATGTIFSFRFKQAAGSEWTSSDPWHKHQEARRMVFLRDGSVRQLAVTPDDDNGDGSIRQVLRRPFYDVRSSEQTPERSAGLEIQWKFVSLPLDLPERPKGAYVRLNVGGRDLPTYVVRRSPNGNWGFLLENCWGVFASFPLPPKKRNNSKAINEIASSSCPPTRSRKVTRSTTPRKRSHGHQDTVHGEPSPSSPPPQKKRKVEQHVVLSDDSDLTVTNALQWREALLYNLGSVVLPDRESQ